MLRLTRNASGQDVAQYLEILKNSYMKCLFLRVAEEAQVVLQRVGFASARVL